MYKNNQLKWFSQDPNYRQGPRNAEGRYYSLRNRGSGWYYLRLRDGDGGWYSKYTETRDGNEFRARAGVKSFKYNRETKKRTYVRGGIKVPDEHATKQKLRRWNQRVPESDDLINNYPQIADYKTKSSPERSSKTARISKDKHYKGKSNSLGWF